MPPLCSEFLDLVNDCLGFQLLLLLLWWWLIEAARVSVVLLEKPTDQWRLDTKLDGNVVVAALCGMSPHVLGSAQGLLLVHTTLVWHALDRPLPLPGRLAEPVIRRRCEGGSRRHGR